jgi:serine protease inhibitor
MGRRTAVAGLVACVLALGACAGGGTPVKTIPPGGDRSAHGLQMGAGVRAAVALDEASAADSVVAATWRAGFAALAAGDPGEAQAGSVVSPASFLVALAMLAEGADGASAATLDAVLGAPGQARTDAVNALSASLARYDGDPAAVNAKELPEKPVVHVANQVVVDDRWRITEAYLDRLVTGYGAGVLVTDLSSDVGTKDLDAWVNKHTGGLVKKSAIVPDPMLALVLQNAVALAARWQQPFDANATSDQEFTLRGGQQVTVPTMHETGCFAYVQRDGWRALRLPYAADLHADVILPPEGSPAAADPARADPATVAALVAALDTAEAQDALVSLPKLDMTTKVDLLGSIRAIGLGQLLDPGTAGLDGILEEPHLPLYLGQAWQQAVLKVDEEGTRAAAVTELGVAMGSAPAIPPVQFLVDRPYLVAVGDGDTGWPLFLASVLDPRG